jgi:hypothetical protein
MQERRGFQEESVVSLHDPDTGVLFYEEVYVYGHLGRERFNEVFWQWHSGLPDPIRKHITGYYNFEHGYGLWEDDLNPDAESEELLYAPIDVSVVHPCRFPVTRTLTKLRGERTFVCHEPYGELEILRTFRGKSTRRDVYVAKPKGFSQEVIFSPDSFLARIATEDVINWKKLWKARKQRC